MSHIPPEQVMYPAMQRNESYTFANAQIPQVSFCYTLNSMIDSNIDR